jgi:HlyD family secretion protein
VNQAKGIISMMGIILAVAIIFYFATTDRSSDLQLIGTVDSNQVVVSAKITGRIEKLTVDEGSEVHQGDLIAQLDTAELQAQELAASANVASLRSRVSGTQSTEILTQGTTVSDVAGAQARVQSAHASLAQAQANLEKAQLDARRMDSLAGQGVASQQDKDQTDAALKAQQALVNSLGEQVRAADADLKSAIARTHQAGAARSTVADTRAQQASAEADRTQAEARLAYARVTAPVSGIVSVRVARQGEVVNPGQPIVTIVDLSDTWVRAPLPETYADRIALGDSLKVLLPDGKTVDGKVIFKAVEADFATQRDVSRSKRDIKTIILKVAVDNSRKNLVPGMTAIVLVPKSKLEGRS